MELGSCLCKKIDLKLQFYDQVYVWDLLKVKSATGWEKGFFGEFFLG